MEELTPELERRIQVEELWGRRVVLEESMNAWRFREYQSRRLICMLCDETRGVRPLRAAPATDRPKTRQPARHLNVISLRRTAVLGGLVLFTWLVAQQAGGKLLAWGLNLPVPSAVSASDTAGAPRTEARMSKAEQELWKHAGDVHASKLRPLDADLKRIFGSSL
jgi:hypothetical protein